MTELPQSQDLRADPDGNGLGIECLNPFHLLCLFLLHSAAATLNFKFCDDFFIRSLKKPASPHLQNQGLYLATFLTFVILNSISYGHNRQVHH